MKTMKLNTPTRSPEAQKEYDEAIEELKGILGYIHAAVMLSPLMSLIQTQGSTEQLLFKYAELAKLCHTLVHMLEQALNVELPDWTTEEAMVVLREDIPEDKLEEFDRLYNSFKQSKEDFLSRMDEIKIPFPGGNGGSTQVH